MKIVKSKLGNLRNDAHFQFHTEFKDLIAKFGADVLKVEEQFASYLPLYKKMDAGLKKINKSVYTVQIQDADKARDEIWSGMIETNKGATKHFDAKIRDAAENLKILFDTYGNLAAKPLNEETAALNNILQELEDKYAAAVKSVGIASWVSELKTRNAALSKLVKERFDESASKSDIVVKTARTALDASYRIITERINALLIVEGDAAYENFMKAWNVIVEKYVVSVRRTKKAAEMIDIPV
jgi:hypothetical protein